MSLLPAHSIGVGRAVLGATPVAVWSGPCLMGTGLHGTGAVLASLLVWAACTAWVAGATPAQARRRLLGLAAMLSFTAAVGVGWHLMAAPLTASRAGSENALGLLFLELLGHWVLSFLLPALLGGVGLLLLVLAWLAGREPTLRRVPRSAMTRPPQR